MDVIIPLSTGSYWHDNELRYCLRSLDKYFLDLGEIYIVGSKPKWVKNINHIPIRDNYPDNKGACIINKITILCINNRISDDFLFVSDDQYMMYSTRSKDIKPYYVYDMKNEALRKGNKKWMQCLRNTKRTLLKEGLPCYNYEPHTPVIINKDKFRETMLKYDWGNIQYPTLSLYFNNILKEHEMLPSNYRAFFQEENIPIDVINGKNFVCHSDLGLSWQLQHKLAELFPKKSRFEK